MNRFSSTSLFIVFFKKEKNVNTQPKRYSRSIQSIVVIFLLVIGIDVRSETRESPACSFMAKQGLDKQVSVLVSKTVEHPGVLWARVANGQEDITIISGYGAVRLERLWFGIVWSSSLHLEDFFRHRQEPWGPLIAFALKPGETRDLPVWTEDENVPPGRYRARFGFLRELPGAKNKKQQYMYSEPISLP